MNIKITIKGVDMDNCIFCGSELRKFICSECKKEYLDCPNFIENSRTQICDECFYGDL